jgi:sugar O-acyltransferase (sialic acid O-acetyltransferase NeuD family)
MDGLWSAIAFLDDAFPKMVVSGPWPVIGRLADLPAIGTSDDACLAALGDASVRLGLLERAVSAGCRVPVLMHPRAVISAHAHVAAGSVVLAGAVINYGATLERGCIVNTAATVDHDCVLAEGVHICPGAHVAGGVSIGARTWFGIGAVAKQNLRIGADVTIGAGAAVVTNVRDGVTVVGVPAREVAR